MNSLREQGDNDRASCESSIGHDELAAQLDRLVHSQTLRSSEGLRRLLKYLGEKTASGEAESLKEYTVGIEGLGRSADHDPRQNAAVRIQIGRLRSKLAEYYSDEGKSDPLLIELPKGAFKLTCTKRDLSNSSSPEPMTGRPRPAVSGLWRWALLAMLPWTIYATARVQWFTPADSGATADWSPEMQQIWGPVLTDRPLLICIADPLFVEFEGAGAYRETRINAWPEALESTRVQALRAALKNPPMRALSRYTTLGEANASFLLGKMLSPRVPHVSLARSSELSWAQLAGNNVVFVGADRNVVDRLTGLPSRLEIVHSRAGIQVRNPQPGEAATYADPSPPGSSEDGEAYAIVSHTAGPNLQSHILTFTGDSGPARLGAVQWFSDPGRVRELAARLADDSGNVAPYYQVVLKIEFHGGVPTNVTYVLSRILRSEEPQPAP